MGLALYVLAGRVVASRPWRALAAVVASQAGAAVRVLAVGRRQGAGRRVGGRAAGRARDPPPDTSGSARIAVLPLAFASAALLAVLSFGGIVWLAPVLIPAARARSGGSAAPAPRSRRRAALVVVTAVLSIPTLLQAETFFEPAKGTFTQRRGAGEPGRAAQPPAARRDLAGRRLPFRAGRPRSRTYVLIGLLLIAACLGVAEAWRRQRLGAAPLSGWQRSEGRSRSAPRVAVGGRQGARQRLTGDRARGRRRRGARSRHAEGASREARSPC